MSSTKNLGKKGEDLAINYLCKNGYKILASNWQYGKEEIDIVAETKELLVFVEVKLRSEEIFGKPYLAVNKAKQKKIIRVANQFILQHNLDKEARFDIISIVFNKSKLEIEHIERAFFATI